MGFVAWLAQSTSLRCAGISLDRRVPSCASPYDTLALAMPTWKRHFAPGQLQFLTSSTYCRVKLFEPRSSAGAERSSALQSIFIKVLSQLRVEMGFLLVGWVLMPDHFHLLIKLEPAAITSQFMQEFKKRTAQRILATLTEKQQNPWCGKMLTRLRLPPSVHADSRF